jgi:DNA-3-methyladenine glycosylase
MKSIPSPDPRLLFDPITLQWEELPRKFFHQDTAAIAQSILGTWLARRYRGQWYGAKIIETEAYLGKEDAAAHSYRGRRTPRVEPMYRNGGHLYVYLIYGIHHCINIVTQTEGIAEAVLLRGAEGPAGTPAKLLSGPGRLSAAMGITTASSGQDLLSDGDIRLFRGPAIITDIGISKRIGVDYAGEASDWPLRFFDKHSAAVSGPARLRVSV